MSRGAIILEELQQWRDEGAISPELHDKLAARYIQQRGSAWDLVVLVRWSLICGAVLLSIGLILLMITFTNSLVGYSVLLTLLACGAFFVGSKLTSSYPRTGNALFTAACLLVAVDVFVIGQMTAYGSHLPLMLLIVTVIYLTVAYIKRNTMVLVLALSTLTLWFYAEIAAPYADSDSFLGCNQLVCFAIASLSLLLVGYLHQSYLSHLVPDSFITTYYAYGLLLLHTSLWLLSFSGFRSQDPSFIERGALSTVFVVVDLGIFVIGSQKNAFCGKMFRGFVIVFQSLHLFSVLHFFLWESIHKLVHSPQLVFVSAGIVLLSVGLLLERRLNACDSQNLGREDEEKKVYWWKL